MHLSSHAYEIKTDTVIVEYNDFQAEQIIVSINNNEEDTLWIWFDDKNVEDEGLYIKKYLMKGHCPECSSFFHIATSANIDNCWWKPSTSIRLFIKCLFPNQTFTIVFYKEKEYDDNTCRNTFSWHDIIKIYEQKVITKYCRGIDRPYGIKRLSYPYNTIVYNYNLHNEFSAVYLNDQPYLGQPFYGWKEGYGYTLGPKNGFLKRVEVKYDGIKYDLGVSDNQTVQYIATSDKRFSVNGYKVGDVITKTHSRPGWGSYTKIDDEWYAAWLPKEENRNEETGRIQWFFKYVEISGEFLDEPSDQRSSAK